MSLRKGVINLINNDKKLQRVQVEGLSGELISNAERIQPFGLSTIPVPPDAEGRGSEVILADLGTSDHIAVIATDDRRYRPTKGVSGDVMVYGIHDTPDAEHADATQRIVLTGDGTNYQIAIKVAATTFNLKSDNTVNISNENGSFSMGADGKFTFVGDMDITGNITTSGTITNNGKEIGSPHTHVGVQTGSGTTGVVT